MICWCHICVVSEKCQVIPQKKGEEKGRLSQPLVVLSEVQEKSACDVCNLVL